ncbi:hypothetical protein GUY44_07425 [Pimelobacter simplex]|uniref:hypothetical protein n=1 Tax=Nocardioides simplex TaxID=2045 RepID=UPI000535F519|nr:hypothetical protein [Pimelobacter simplex]MCG8150304.1 hypothetical protein [Pimelobacter simplex]GEB16669.1 hypothetical protein NSI01_49840 [Pimelobacter simplex]SFM90262.1 hypothetical protein SAMN05421671_4114 [Pimelobacter simplex]
MGRKLSTTVQVGPYIYEAGTDEADIKGADTIAADVWGSEVASTEPETGEFAVAEVAALRQQYDAQLAERDDRIVDLEVEIKALTAEIEQLKAEAPDPAPAAPADYSSLDLDALKAEIDGRNEGRPDGDRISKRGSVETLVAALIADDEAQG